MSNGDDVLDNWEEFDEAGVSATTIDFPSIKFIYFLFLTVTIIFKELKNSITRFHQLYNGEN